ncbi:hypothetical protein BSY16_5106 (plasmid) [Sinorhizobium sp. RAC02]|nr:hypothetical protein BSY16_5106 [Sinorhizobium sp. RAC02]
MMRRVTRPSVSTPVRRGGESSRWCASNAILAMLGALFAIACIIEFLRG